MVNLKWKGVNYNIDFIPFKVNCIFINKLDVLKSIFSRYC